MRWRPSSSSRSSDRATRIALAWEQDGRRVCGERVQARDIEYLIISERDVLAMITARPMRAAEPEAEDRHCGEVSRHQASA
jgi:hypothetical protein